MLADGHQGLPLKLTATRPLDEAISTAGGVDVPRAWMHN